MWIGEGTELHWGGHRDAAPQNVFRCSEFKTKTECGKGTGLHWGEHHTEKRIYWGEYDI